MDGATADAGAVAAAVAAAAAAAAAVAAAAAAAYVLGVAITQYYSDSSHYVHPSACHRLLSSVLSCLLFL